MAAKREGFDLKSFYQGIVDIIPNSRDGVFSNFNEVFGESSTMQTNEDNSSKLDDDKFRTGGFNQYKQQSTSDHFVKDPMEMLTSRDPLTTESGDIGRDSIKCLVQKPLSDVDDEREFETFMDKEHAESKTVHGTSLGLKSYTSVEETFDNTISSSSFLETNREEESRISYKSSVGLKGDYSVEDKFLDSNRITGNLGYKSESADASFQTFSEDIQEKSRTPIESSFRQKGNASFEDIFLSSDKVTENLGYNSESIDISFQPSSFSEDYQEKSRNTTESSKILKGNASVEKTLLGKDQITENIGYNSESIDSSYQSLFSEDFEEEKSKITNDSSLRVKGYASVEETSFCSDRISENIGYNTGSIDLSYQSSSLSEDIEKEISSIFNNPSLRLKNDASVEQTPLCSDRTTENIGYTAESIDSSYQAFSFSEDSQEESRIANEYSLPSKSDASVEDILLSSDRVPKNLGYNSESIDSSFQASFYSGDNKEISRNTIESSKKLKGNASVEKTLLGSDQITESIGYNSESIDSSFQSLFLEDIQEEKSGISNDYSLRMKGDASVEETPLGSDGTTEITTKVRDSIKDLVKEDFNNNPSLVDDDEYTDYYLTPNTTTMKVIRHGDEDQILRCRVDGFTCNFCGRKFRSRDKLREHKLDHVSFVPSGAHICSRYSRRYCIIEGYNNSRQVQYKCSHCRRRFKSIADYGRHCSERICKGERSYLVSPFVQKCQLDNGEEGYECLLCQESSTVYTDMKFHECVISRDLPENCYENSPSDEDDDSEDKWIKCDLCEVEFHGSKNYEEHRVDHAKGDKYECKVCLKSYKRLCSFKSHMETHSKGKTRPKQTRPRSAKHKP